MADHGSALVRVRGRVRVRGALVRVRGRVRVRGALVRVLGVGLGLGVRWLGC